MISREEEIFNELKDSFELKLIEKPEEKYPDGYYYEFPCICTEKCKDACTGECGCKACAAAYNDFLSVE